MADKVFMQVVQKSTNYKEGKSRLDLFETNIKDIVRNIKDAATPTLSTVATEDFISTGLLGDIKTKQEEFTTTSSDFDDYIADIQALADTDPRADLTPYTTWTYTYSAIVAADIAADEPVTYEILRQIMNNEGYFHERRINIMLMLVYLRDFAIDTQMLGLWEIYPSQYAVLDAIADADLILEDLTDAQIGGDNTMLLKENSITRTYVEGTGTTYITLGSDEVLWSLDRYDVVVASGAEAEFGIRNDGITGSNTTNFSGSTAANRTIENANTYGLGTVAYISLSGSSHPANTITLYYTTRQIISYT